MNAVNEELCIKALEKLCEKNFDYEDYSLTGEKEYAVCLEKTHSGWNVYEKERNAHNDSFLFTNAIEAGLDFLRRLSPKKDYEEIKNEFFDSLFSQSSLKKGA